VDDAGRMDGRDALADAVRDRRIELVAGNRRRSVSPSTYSIVRNRTPSCSPISNVRATFAWVTRRASLTSSRKLASESASSAPTILSATVSSSSRSRTR
jgi:hypothetical protein